jgi:hypothetical protein
MFSAEDGKLKAILPYALPREIKIRLKGSKVAKKFAK